MPQNRTVLLPQYLSKFSCIGDKCEDNCCYSWEILIDKDIYEKYRKTSNSYLKPMLDKYVKRNRSNPTIEGYSKIKLNSARQCPFLNENKLCEIHKNLGEEYLSKVCTTYPRITNIIDKIYEKSATLSCPEIARLILLNPQVMEFDEIEEPIETRNIIYKKNDSKSIKNLRKLLKYFWKLRIFSITLMQNRRYKLWERLIILGLFIQKLSEYEKKDIVDEIPELIEQYNKIIDSEYLRLELEKIPVNTNIQMELMKEINDQRFSISIGPNTKVYVGCVIEFLQGIQYTKDEKVENIAERYNKAFDNYYKPFMDEHEYILENYIVNYMFRELFPISSNKDVFQDYINLVINYSYIKTLLIGIAGFNKQLNEDIIVKFIYSFSRTIEHNYVFMKKIIDIIKANGYDTMAYMAILIKN